MYPLIRRYYDRKRNEWHDRRADLFVELMRPAPGTTILDLGGASGELSRRLGARVAARITVADLGEPALAVARERGFATVQLVEGEPLPFADGEFDLVFCNSVIEHVTLPKAECTKKVGNREWVERAQASQRAFASEIRRVGKRYFVQTPHRAFPIEAHTWLPFVGYMPHNATAQIVRVADRMWVKHCGYVDWHLLDAGAMRALFPDAAIHIERVLGMPKSLIAYSSGAS